MAPGARAAAHRSPAAGVARAAAHLLDGVADPAGRGLLLRGREQDPLDTRRLAQAGRVVWVAAEGLVRVARLAEDAAEALRAHPEPRVRRAAACLAARAYPLLTALGEMDGTLPAGMSPSDAAVPGASRPAATAAPDDLAWLAAVVRRSALVRDPGLRRHWLTVLPWLPVDARYRLAAALVAAEQRMIPACPA